VYFTLDAVSYAAPISASVAILSYYAAEVGLKYLVLPPFGISILSLHVVVCLHDSKSGNRRRAVVVGVFASAISSVTPYPSLGAIDGKFEFHVPQLALLKCRVASIFVGSMTPLVVAGAWGGVLAIDIRLFLYGCMVGLIYACPLLLWTLPFVFNCRLCTTRVCHGRRGLMCGADNCSFSFSSPRVGKPGQCRGF